MAINRKEGLTDLERTFKLARTGAFADPWEIARRLKSDSYNVDQITGRALLRQLRAICKSARGSTMFPATNAADADNPEG